VIAPDLVERTLATALARGGDFAEVFAEDRQNVTARLDDGRVEELVSGRSRETPQPAPEAKLPSEAEVVSMVRKLREHVAKHSEYVGPRFAEEARKIHHEEAEARGIHGEASAQEVKLLKEEGVELYPLPVLPEEHN